MMMKVVHRCGRWRSKQMEALGDRMDKLSQQAERETLQLIDEAMAKGLAKPAPVRR